MLSGRRLRGDDGAALVEGAIVIPVLLAITLAVIEFGMLFSSVSTTTSASRDGARYATTFYATRADKVAVGNDIRAVVEHDLKALTNQGQPVRMWIYKANASGQPTGGLECTADCLRYSWSPTDGEFVYQPGSSSVWTNVDACFDTATRTIDEIGVMVEVRHDLLTGVVGSGNRVLRERTVLRLEPLPTNQCPG
jgi:hypothetical protein